MNCIFSVWDLHRFSPNSHIYQVSNSVISLKAKGYVWYKTQTCPFFFKCKLNPELSAYIGVSPHITNGLSEYPFTTTLYWSLDQSVWITVAWPHLKVSNIAAGSNTRSTWQSLFIIHCRATGESSDAKTPTFIMAALDTAHSLNEVTEYNKKGHPWYNTTHIRKSLGLMHTSVQSHIRRVMRLYQEAP